MDIRAARDPRLVLPLTESVSAAHDLGHGALPCLIEVQALDGLGSPALRRSALFRGVRPGAETTESLAREVGEGKAERQRRQGEGRS